MAKCVKCGWHHQDHIDVSDGWHLYFIKSGNPNIIARGRKNSLNDCKGYVAPKARPRKYRGDSVLVIIDGFLVDIGS